MRKNTRGQVWIETVTYTLVAFVIIGLVLGFARPKIQDIQDKTTIDQSIVMLKDIDSVITRLNDAGVGNKRKIELNIRKGELEINATNDSISFFIEGKHQYSELGQLYQEGEFEILTNQKGDFYNVSIKRTYDNLNFTYVGKEESKKISSSPTPYILFIQNNGGSTFNIDFEFE